MGSKVNGKSRGGKPISIDEDYSFIECLQNRKFLQNNPIGSIFDLEDEPKNFELFILGDEKDMILEIDTQMPDEVRQHIQDLIKKPGHLYK